MLRPPHDEESRKRYEERRQKERVGMEKIRPIHEKYRPRLKDAYEQVGKLSKQVDEYRKELVAKGIPRRNIQTLTKPLRLSLLAAQDQLDAINRDMRREKWHVLTPEERRIMLSGIMWR